MAAKIQITSTLNSTQYKRGIKEMQNSNKKFAKQTKGIQSMMKKAFAIGAILAFVKATGRAITSLVNFGSNLTDLASQSDLSVEKLQEYDLAVREAGGNTDQLTNALIQLKAKQGDTLSGNKEYAQSFEILGITMQDLANMKTEQVFEKVARSLTESGNGVKEYNAALELLGKRGGGRLIEALNIIGSSAGDAGRELNTLSTRDAQTLDLIADKWANLKNSMKVSLARGVAAFGGNLQSEVEERLRAQERMDELAKASRQEAKEQLRISEAQKDLEEKRVAVAELLKKQAEEKSQVDKAMEGIEKRVNIEIGAKGDMFREVGGVIGGMLSSRFIEERRQMEVEQRQEKYLAQIATNTANGGLA